MVPTIVHCEIHAGDPERARRFYRRVFGWRFDPTPAMEGYWSLSPEDGGEGPDAAIMRRRLTPADEAPIHAFVCTVAVDRLDPVVEEVAAAGGEVVQVPQMIPGVGRFVHVRDSEGNVLGILEPES